MGLRIYTDVIAMTQSMRPVLATLAKRDADLARQTRRALTSIALNLAEGQYQQAGHARMRFQTAMGSADEVRACLQGVGKPECCLRAHPQGSGRSARGPVRQAGATDRR